MLEDAKEEFDKATSSKKMQKFLKTLKIKVLEDHCRHCKEKSKKAKEAAEAAELKKAKAAAAEEKARKDRQPRQQSRQGRINFQPEECGDYSGVKGCSREHCKMLHGGQKALHNPTGRVMRARAKPVEVNLAIQQQIQQQATEQLREDEVECQMENLMAQWKRLDAMGTGPGPGGIPDPNPNPNPNHASGAKYKHPNSHDHPDNKLKQAYFLCGGERLEVPQPHPKGWEKGKPAKTTGKAYHANQLYHKQTKQGSKPCTLKSCDRRSRSDQAGDWRNPLGGHSRNQCR